MPVINFDKEWALDVTQRIKRQTIRKRKFKIGDILDLRSDDMLMGIATCRSCEEIEILMDDNNQVIRVDDKTLGIVEAYHLAQKDGFTVCKALRKAPQTAMVPIIILSARREQYDKLTGFELGADDYITKPFKLEELMTRAGSLLRGAVASSSVVKAAKIASISFCFAVRSC